MFSGIIEAVGVVKKITSQYKNISFLIESSFADELKIDQSVAHNGVCLTVTQIEANSHWVTAIDETLQKSNLRFLEIGSIVNLERCIRMNDRLDGHLVQGHVDQTAICVEAVEQGGSWKYTFQYDASVGNITVEKGSITVNGVSLTVVDSKDDSFSVAIIPYTYEHTNFKKILKNDLVNLEFDIIGKYISKLYQKK